MCITLIAVVLWEYGAAFLATVDFHLIHAGAACKRMWAFLARGQCGLSGAQVAHGPPFASGYYVSCMYYDHIVHVKHACFDCCPYWAAMRHLIVCYKTHIFICVKCSFCISRYIQMNVEQSYCECLTVLICILLWMVSNGVLNLRLQVNAHVSWYGADSYMFCFCFLFHGNWVMFC